MLNNNYFTIVVPVYNKNDVIKTTLESVLAQRFTGFELIIIDDGSTDQSVQSIATLNDSRIHLIQQVNQGVSAARNVGISHAKGDWICFLDADDWWHPEYLENVKNTIKLNSQADIVSTGFACLPDQENWKPEPWKLNSTNEDIEVISNLPQRWMNEIPFFTSSICVKRKTLEAIDEWFAEGESKGEDLDLWFRLAENTFIYHLPTALVVYRTEQIDSLSNTEDLAEEPFFTKQLIKRLQNNSVPNKLKTSSLKFIAHEKLTRARQLIIAENRSFAIKLIFQARYAINTKRWWMTLSMALLLPATFIQSWQNKRSGRRELTT